MAVVGLAESSENTARPVACVARLPVKDVWFGTTWGWAQPAVPRDLKTPEEPERSQPWLRSFGPNSLAIGARSSSIAGLWNVTGREQQTGRRGGVRRARPRDGKQISCKRCACKNAMLCLQIQKPSAQACCALGRMAYEDLLAASESDNRAGGRRF